MLQVAALAMRGGAPGRGPASKHAYQAPNVLVAHLEEGIEAVHLYSGRTLCKLHLPPSGLHADLNGDGVLDHVQVRAAPCVETLLYILCIDISHTVDHAPARIISKLPRDSPGSDGNQHGSCDLECMQACTVASFLQWLELLWSPSLRCWQRDRRSMATVYDGQW